MVVTLKDGTRVEVANEGSGWASARGGLPESLEDIQPLLEKLSGVVHRSFALAEEYKVEEAEVELSLGLEGGGWFIAKASGNIKIKFKVKPRAAE